MLHLPSPKPILAFLFSLRSCLDPSEVAEQQMASGASYRNGAAKQSLKLDRSLFSNSNIKPSLKPKQSSASATAGVRRSSPASLAAAAAKDDTGGQHSVPLLTWCLFSVLLNLGFWISLQSFFFWNMLFPFLLLLFLDIEWNVGRMNNLFNCAFWLGNVSIHLWNLTGMKIRSFF